MSLTYHRVNTNIRKSVRIIADEDTHTLNIILSELYYSTI